MIHEFAKTLKRTEEELKLAGYSPRTVSSYLGVASRFLRFADRPAEKVSRDDVRQYFVYLTKRGQAPSSINQAHFGVRFLIKEVLKKEWRQPLRLHRARADADRAQPHEVCTLLTATESQRYRTIWMAQYASGLRSSEVVQLRVLSMIALMEPPMIGVMGPHAVEDWADEVERLTGEDPRRCPVCGKGRLVLLEVVPSRHDSHMRAARAPP